MSAFKRQTQRVRPGSVRWAALVLCAVLLVMPLLLRQNVQAAGWMEPYLQQVTDWGVMRGDSSGELHPDRAITRAEFVTLVNRAFGYTEVGPNPFSDVQDSDWYAEDIRIARKAGYFNGTSDNTASPRSLVTLPVPRPISMTVCKSARSSGAWCRNPRTWVSFRATPTAPSARKP